MPYREVLPGIIWIDLPWTNVWLLYDGNRSSLIDTGTCHDRSAVLADLSHALPDGCRITDVYLTHGHCDHAGNAAFLCENFGANLSVGKEEVPFVATRKTYIPPGVRAIGLRGLIFAGSEIIFPVKRRPVDVCVLDGDTVDSPIGPLTAIHTPGHTIGHMSYYHSSRKILFSGDALLTVIPFIRKGGLSIAPSFFSVDRSAAVRSIHRLAELEPDAILAGHGWPVTESATSSLHAYARSLRTNGAG